MHPREFHFNGDFDATLRGSPSVLDGSESTFVHEMAVHFLFAGGPGDTLLLHRPLPADFAAYLDAKRMAHPAIVIHPALTPDADFTPFGWNAHAEALNRRYRRPSAHPPLEAVKRANSRAFSAGLEREWDGAEGTLFDSLPDLERRIAARPGSYVVKANHGHAGTANFRLFGSALSADERKALEDFLREGGSLALEPWHERLLDMAVNFHVLADGAIDGLCGHTLINSRDGAFLGLQVAPDRQVPEPWRAPLAERARRLGKSLAAIGYFGPVGVDAYVHAAEGAPTLRPMADINARFSMALPAHSLAGRLPGKWLRWEWFRPKKLAALPATYAELSDLLGADDFRTETGEGILAISPLWVQPREGRRAAAPQAARPRRIGFLFSAATEDALAALRQAFPLKEAA